MTAFEFGAWEQFRAITLVNRSGPQVSNVHGSGLDRLVRVHPTVSGQKNKTKQVISTNRRVTLYKVNRLHKSKSNIGFYKTRLSVARQSLRLTFGLCIKAEQSLTRTRMAGIQVDCVWSSRTLGLAFNKKHQNRHKRMLTKLILCEKGIKRLLFFSIYTVKHDSPIK